LPCQSFLWPVKNIFHENRRLVVVSIFIIALENGALSKISGFLFLRKIKEMEKTILHRFIEL